MNLPLILITCLFYSSQWRIWAACYIQALWRRHWKRKFDECLRQSGVCSSRPPQRLAPLLPWKPAQPDFTSEHS
ncbi:hypothetical protein F8388_003884 [Cannabis sativa]|uniref:Uncharacterized protein n=1 Tax=Cannabis sativa TaxID=3483 RepID=A0A7J6GNV7_CANSA|nr:hypothetical protein F8388_003884 [Cannabis sativa]